MSQFTQEQLNTVKRNEEGQAIINPEIFAAQVDLGWKREQFMKHYDIPNSQLTLILNALNLKIRKFHKPKFVIEGMDNTALEEAVNKQQTKEVVEEDTAEEVVEKPTKVKKTKKVEEVEEEVEEVAQTEEDMYSESVDDNDFGSEESEEVEEESTEDDDEEWV